MIGIGYFAEHYGRGYPAFQAAVLSAPEKAKVLEYLKSGSVFAAAPGIMKDAFTNRRIPGEMLAYTDGKYYWLSETIYYFEKYNFELPDAFLKDVL